MEVSGKKPKVRTTEPFRTQGMMRWEFPEDLVGIDRPARAIWDVLGTFNLAPFTATANAMSLCGVKRYSWSRMRRRNEPLRPTC